MGEFIRELESSLRKGFIDKNFNSTKNFKPELLINDHKKSENVLNAITSELETCESFIFSVAFITESGLAMLKAILLDLKHKGIKGRILTSTYLYFNQPKIFRELQKISNVDVRLTSLEGFHSKGYIFKQASHYSLIVGSSNLTAHALKVNYEWNVKLTSHENGELVSHFKNQFEDVWASADKLTEEWIAEYEEIYEENAEQQGLDKVVDPSLSYQPNVLKDALDIRPNKMQEAALLQIEALRTRSENKGLIVSATGTGKTYLSAFDVRRYQPKRMLFIVHREQILNQAKEDFQKVLGGLEHEFGLYVGNTKQHDRKYVFASIQTLSKTENLKQFNPKEFDYILIDEVHKAGAPSYLKVINYFEPNFLMGMTATPERTDDFNIYELFDYNIAYEIRLQEALEEDMLCPFHYFGVVDFEIDGQLFEETSVLSKLITEERVNHIIDKINYYGYSGDTVKGLMFCSRKDEAKALSIALNSKGFRTVSLTGEHTQQEREYYVNRLENGHLDYILTVDIFNEGIDIPCLNQIIMLRQTESSIVFIQQLGRGLRKHYSKQFVTVIDFNGNYKNNYLIPIALSGDQSQNKDNIRRRIKDTSYIKGVSTINFEEIAKRKIFSSINASQLTSLKILREAYNNLKNKIGRLPFLKDFIQNHSIDPVVLVEKHENYYQFLLKMKEDISALSIYENQVLTMLSMEILHGKRWHELVLLKMLLEKSRVSKRQYIEQLLKHNCVTDSATIRSVERIFSLDFFTQNNQKKYGFKPIIHKNDEDIYELNAEIEISLSTHPLFKRMILDIVETAMLRSVKYNRTSSFTLYEKYTRKDACKLLDWDKDESATIFGYKIKHNTCPIFVTYHKQDVESSVDYGDELLNENIFKWYTRSNRTLQSQEVRKIIDAEKHGIDIHIFVKKDDDEGKDFYYLGRGTPDISSVREAKMLDGKGKELPVVHMNLLLEETIDDKLYHYMIDR